MANNGHLCAIYGHALLHPPCIYFHVSVLRFPSVGLGDEEEDYAHADQQANDDWLQDDGAILLRKNTSDCDRLHSVDE